MRGADQQGAASHALGKRCGFSRTQPCRLSVVDAQYRSGALKFSDGSDDSNVAAGLQPLAEATGTNECSSQQAFGDLLQNVEGGGGCAGAHHTAFNCPWQGGVAQNSCCGMGGGSWGVGDGSAIATYEGVRDKLFGCLQAMWDEGITEGVKGHWETMRNPNFRVAHCGFAFTASGRLMANQDFANTVSSSYLRCSCSGKLAGADDGCGGACVACSDPTLPACADVATTGTSGTGCSGDDANGGMKKCTCMDHVEKNWLQGCEDEGIRASCPVSCNACPAYQTTCPKSETSQSTGEPSCPCLTATSVGGYPTFTLAGVTTTYPNGARESTTQNPD